MGRSMGGSKKYFMEELNRSVVSIIIPVYNHAREACDLLKRLGQQTYRPFEVIMVDDGSTDDLQAHIKNMTLSFPFTSIRRETNSGIASVARNEGFRQAKGDLLLFLDADVSLHADAIEKMVHACAREPEAAFAFSSFLFGRIMFRGRDFDRQELARCNYIHTTSLIRRKDFAGFDESLRRFQDWDLWLTMAEQGKRGVRVDEVLFSVSVNRWRDVRMSRWLPKFMYAIPWERIGWMPASVRSYREAEEVIRRKHALPPVKKRGALMESFHGMRIFVWFFGIAAAHLLSRFVVFHSDWNSGFALLLAVMVFVLMVFRPSLALSILAIEHIVGSKGALFKLGGDAVNDGGVSIRILFFSACMIGWLVWSWRKKTYKQWPLFIKKNTVFLVLAAAVVYAFILGVVRGNPFIFQDANAWGAWLFLLPAMDIARHEGTRLKDRIVPALMAALAWLTLESMAFFFLFTHGWLHVHDATYLWIRRTGIGEITNYGFGLHRIFIQSQIYAVLAAFILVGRAFIRRTALVERGAIVLLLATIMISLSRSFWLGLGAGMIILFFLSLRGPQRRRTVGPVAFSVSALILSIFVVWFIYVLPGSRIEPRAPFVRFFLSRVDAQEGAALSRYQLLPILWSKIKEHPVMGSGFGATVTYHSQDPRAVEKTGGLITTYAFEWGWLEHWIKFGVIGIPLMLWLLVSIARRSGQYVPIASLAVIHLFTPYLNHPLGIGFLVFLTAASTIPSSFSLADNS